MTDFPTHVLLVGDLSYYDLAELYVEEPAWKDESGIILDLIRDRPDLMFRSTFKSSPGRKSFFNLPGEVRNMIYDYALFDDSESRHWRMRLEGPDSRCRPEPRPIMLAPDNFQVAFRISTLRMLGAMNKQIRQEARSWFWSTLRVEFIHGSKSHHEEVQQFLVNIGQDGASAIRTLDTRGLPHPDSSLASYHAFHELLDKLTLCQNLRKMSFNLMISNIFRGDRTALEAHFLHGKPLKSPSLERFANFLSSLPNLEELHIYVGGATMAADIRGWTPKKDIFLAFAFSGLRKYALWATIYGRLQANDLGGEIGRYKLNDKVTVWMERPKHESLENMTDSTDFTVWLANLTSNQPAQI